MGSTRPTQGLITIELRGLHCRKMPQSLLRGGLASFCLVVGCITIFLLLPLWLYGHCASVATRGGKKTLSKVISEEGTLGFLLPALVYRCMYSGFFFHLISALLLHRTSSFLDFFSVSSKLPLHSHKAKWKCILNMTSILGGCVPRSWKPK